MNISNVKNNLMYNKVILSVAKNLNLIVGSGDLDAPKK